MTAKSKLETKYDPSTPRPVRWWPAFFILAAAAGALTWIWGWYGVSRQDRNIAAAQVIVFGAVLLLLWLVVLSRAPQRIRWSVLGGFVGLIIFIGVFFRIRGVTGDLLPILEFRWKNRATRSVESFARLPANQVIRTSTNDYPQFLGPNRNAQVAGPKLARDWNANPPRLIWRQPIGAAWSGFAIVADHAVTQEQRGDDEMVVCYDLLSGKMIWSHADKAHYFTTIAGEGPRATPTILSNRVYSLGATGLLDCLDLGTGRLLWSKDIIKENQSHIPEWGLSGSPLVIDKLVVVSAGGHEGHSLVAYDRESGQLVWSGGDDGAGFSSPCLATLGGAPQILIFNAHSLAAHAINSGKVLWDYPWPGGHPHVAMPVILPENQVLISSGYGTGSEVVKIQADKKWLPRRLWKSTRLKAKFTNVVFRDGYIYGLDDGILVCLDASNGELKWKEGRYGHGQVILDDDLLLVMGESGDLILIEPVPVEHRRLASFAILSGKTWNPPALAGEYLLVRNDKEAACYQLPVAK